MRRWGLRVDVVVAGSKDVARVKQALVTTAAPRTVITPALAAKIAPHLAGPQVCSSSPSIGRRCGPTARVDVLVNGCEGAMVRAVVALLPRGLEMAIGRDVIERSVNRIQFSPSRPAQLVCRVPRR